MIRPFKAQTGLETPDAETPGAEIRRRDLLQMGAALFLLLLFPLWLLFSPSSYDGLVLTLAAGDGAGDRVTLDSGSDQIYVIEFWASWCHPCAETTEHLNIIADRYLSDVEVIGINTDMSEQALEEHPRFGATYPSAIDPSGDLMERFGVSVLPTIIVLRGAEEIERVEGVPTLAEFDRLIRNLRNAPS